MRATERERKRIEQDSIVLSNRLALLARECERSHHKVLRTEAAIRRLSAVRRRRQQDLDAQAKWRHGKEVVSRSPSSPVLSSFAGMLQSKHKLYLEGRAEQTLGDLAIAKQVAAELSERRKTATRVRSESLGGVKARNELCARKRIELASARSAELEAESQRLHLASARLESAASREYQLIAALRKAKMEEGKILLKASFYS